MISSAPAATPRARRTRLAQAFLNIAIAVACAPGLLLTLAMLTSIFGLTDWKSGFGAFALLWGANLALLSVALAVVGLIVALVGGFSRLWSRALAGLVISALTVGVFVFVRNEQLTRPPVDETVADWVKPG